jgi:hypothetical protein
MAGIVETLRFKERSASYEMAPICKQAADEIERLRLWIRRIDNINDDPAHFSKEIDDACRDALAGKPMTGKINAP